MDFEAALQALGINASVDARAARRAYMRAVKAHPPERDPDGFRRVREAYECVSQELSWRQASTAEPEPDAGEAFPVMASSSTESRRAVAPVAGLSVPQETPAAPHAAPDVDAYSAEARWALVEDLDGNGREEEAEEAMLEAHRSGLRGFLENLLWRCPERLTLDELEAAVDDPSFDVRAAAASALMERGRPVAAARALRSLLAAAARGETTVPPVFMCARAILELFARGKAKTAWLLEEETRSWLDAHGDFRSLRGSLASWALVQELRVLRADLPADVLSAMASAILANAPLQANDAIARYCVLRTDDAIRVRARMRHRTPNLSNLFNSAFSDCDPPPADRAVSGSVAWRIGWAVLLIGSFRVFRSCTDDAGPPVTVNAPRPAITLAASSPTVLAAADAAKASLAAELAGVASRLGFHGIAQQADLLASATLAGDCGMIRDELQRLEAEHKAAADPVRKLEATSAESVAELQDLVVKVKQYARERCASEDAG
jgi:hypothetical protein